jgi:hypothetical protein
MRTVLQTGAFLALLVAGAQAQPMTRAAEKKASQPIRGDLASQTFGKLHTLIRPHDNEWRHLQVQWLSDVVAARKKAAAEDKPILICYTGGAGYNEPLGVC